MANPQERWVWIPGEGVGPVRFGHHVAEYIDQLGLELRSRDRDDQDEWTEYESIEYEVEIS